MVKYIIVVPNYWGRGATLEEAHRNLRAAQNKRPAKRLPSPRIVYRYDDAATSEAFIDDMGALCWRGVRPVEIEKVLS